MDQKAQKTLKYIIKKFFTVFFCVYVNQFQFNKTFIDEDIYHELASSSYIRGILIPN